MSDWDLFSPSAAFGDDNSQSSNPASAKEQIIYETAKAALEKQSKVQVKTPDETFKAYVQTITYQDDGRLIHFNAYDINNTDLKLPRAYFAHDINALNPYDSDEESFDFTDLPNNQTCLDSVSRTAYSD